MKVYYSGDKVEFNNTAVALGNFDGLHIAHMKIINAAIDYAKAKDAKSGVLLFDHHSTEVTRSRNVALIMPNSYKIKILEEAGVDFVYLVKFDKDFMQKSPEEFIQFLKNYLKIGCVSVGYDYQFGHKAMGNTDLLHTFGDKYNFSVSITEKVTLDNVLVGSTYIRELINKGDIEQANKFLGRQFFIEGIVVKGFQNGKKMGFPTANLDYNKKLILPPDGVYAGITVVDGVRCKSVINIGNNPTFDAKEKTIESHILDFDRDIYDEYVRVELVKRLRGEIKFSGMDELKSQIQQDAENAKKIEIF